MIRKVKYFPLKVILGFLIITELLVYIGPVDYQLYNPILLAGYLLLLNASFYQGYKCGVRTFKPSTYIFKDVTIKFLIIIGSICLFDDFVSIWNHRDLSVLNYIDVIIGGIQDSGNAYYAEMEEIDTSYLRMLLSPFSWGCIPLCIYYWAKAGKFFRILTCMNILVVFSTWFGIGVRKGIFDVIVVSLFSIIALYPILITNRKYYYRLKLVTVILGIAFSVYFVISNLSRYSIGGNEVTLAVMSVSNLKPLYVDVLTYPGAVALSTVCSYLCQGYIALSAALNIGFVSPTFMGMSWFTIALAKKFGFDPTPGTYTKLLENYGYDMSINWHTAYVWFANDFTFIGVPVIVYFIGKYLAKTWCDCVYGKNMIAFPTMVLFVMMAFYLYANNQIFSFSFVPFVFWFGYYVVSIKKIVWR